MLNFTDQAALTSVVRRTNAMLNAEDRVAVAAMQAICEQCREDGYVFAEHTVRPGGGVIAMPVFTNRMQFAVGVHGATLRLQKNKLKILDVMKKELAAASPSFI